MTTLESIRLDPIMNVAERAGRGRAFYEIFSGTAASDQWLLDFERPDGNGVQRTAADSRAVEARITDTSSGAHHDNERKAA